MADLFKRYDVGATYIEIEPGAESVNLQPQDDIAGVRIELSDTQSPSDHDLFGVAEPLEFTSAGHIPAGCSLWARSSQPTQTVKIIARSFP